MVGAHFEPDYPLNNATMFEKELTLRFTIGDPAHDRERLLGLAGTVEFVAGYDVRRRRALEVKQRRKQLGLD